MPVVPEEEGIPEINNHNSSSMLDKLTDNECIDRFKRNNEEAVFNCLLARYSMAIRRIIFTVLKEGDPHETEDIEQEVAIALYTGLNDFSFKSSFKTYLYRLCRNKAIDHIREKEKEKRLLKKISRIGTQQIQELPEEIVEKEEEKKIIVQTLFDLPESERILIVLKDAENMSLKEISEILDKPVGTVKSQLHRARVHAAKIYMRKQGDEFNEK